jgi:lysyl-tRNA synthetase class I|tara:strand:- start:28 stop:357 length:330 start_codon:yes stop_codon:yes gene_type:complete
MKKCLLTILAVLFLSTQIMALEYKPGKKHLNKEGVIGLLLIYNGKMIEHVFKPNISACMKSKRVAQREMDASNDKEGRVQFVCKILVADLEEDSQTKYGLRIIKVHSGV